MQFESIRICLFDFSFPFYSLSFNHNALRTFLQTHLTRIHFRPCLGGSLWLENYLCVGMAYLLFAPVAILSNLLKNSAQGAWVVQRVNSLFLASIQVTISRFMTLSPTSSFVLIVWNLLQILCLLSALPPFILSLPLSLNLSLSKINKR